jgi:hypothetical protein
MSAIEWCECCLSEAPSWSSAEYGEWVVLLARDGEYLGVICAGCVADEELLLGELEQANAAPGGRRPRDTGRGRSRRGASGARRRLAKRTSSALA